MVALYLKVHIRLKKKDWLRDLLAVILRAWAGTRRDAVVESLRMRTLADASCHWHAYSSIKYCY